MTAPWIPTLPCDRQSLEKMAAAVKSPDDLIRVRLADPPGWKELVGLHEMRVLSVLMLAGDAAIIDGNHRYTYRGESDISLLDVAVRFGHTAIAVALAQRGDFPPCKLHMSDLWIGQRELSRKDPAWQQDAQTGWWSVTLKAHELCWGGAEEGWWPEDWHCDLYTSQASCDTPAVRVALAAISMDVDGVVDNELSPDVECRLLDAAVLLGEPVAAAKLAGRCGTRKPLRLWRAGDLLVSEPDDTDIDGDENDCLLSGGKLLQLDVVHAAACAGIDLSTLRIGERPFPGYASCTSIGNVFEVVVHKGYEEIAKSLCKAGADPHTFDNTLTKGLLLKASEGFFDGVQCALSVGVDVGTALLDFEHTSSNGGFQGWLGAFDFSIIYGQLDCALHLDIVGADATPDGCTWISTIISNPNMSLPPEAVHEDILDVLPKVVQFQYRRRLACTFHTAAVPVLQWFGWWKRHEGHVAIYNLSLLKLVLSYAACRPALMSACLGMTGRQGLDDLASMTVSSNDQAVITGGLHLQPFTDDHMQQDPGDIAESSLDKDPDGVKDELNIEEALRLSTDEAALEESAQVAEAIVRSKADVSPLSADDAVIYRLTCISAKIVDVLLQASELSEARARVTAAGCKVRPSFANGAMLLIPLTAEQLAEMALTVEAHHVIALRGDQPDLEKALRLVPCKHRPKLRGDHRAAHVERDDAEMQQTRSMSEQDACRKSGNDVDGAARQINESHTELQLVEERTIGAVVPIVRYTFIHVPEPCDASQASIAWHSAPCSTPAEDHPQPPNPRHWR